jgi:hypothetical protein
VAVHSPGAVVVDGAGQSATLIAPLQKAGVTVTRTGPGQMAAAAGGLHDAVLERRLAHMDQAVLNAAVEGRRPAHARRRLGLVAALVAVERHAPGRRLACHWAVAGGNMAQPVELLAWI